jgi:hypothetical protein
MSQSPTVFRFGLARLLVLIALIGLWLAGLRTLPAPWSVWLTTAVFYVGLLLCIPKESR